MPVDVDVAAVAALIGHPARAAMLDALVGDRGLPASELASVAGVSAPTASSHLAQLRDGGLVRVERHGRHRYYRLASADVADVVEALARIAPPRAPKGLRAHTRAGALRHARTCYDHLAGVLGVALADALQRSGTLERSDDGFRLGGGGERQLRALGIDAAALRAERRVLIRACLDWSERRPHVAGALGAALLQRLHALGWIERQPGSRAVRITPAGQAGLTERLGVELNGDAWRAARGGSGASALHSERP